MFINEDILTQEELDSFAEKYNGNRLEAHLVEENYIHGEEQRHIAKHLCRRKDLERVVLIVGGGTNSGKTSYACTNEEGIAYKNNPNVALIESIVAHDLDELVPEIVERGIPLSIRFVSRDIPRAVHSTWKRGSNKDNSRDIGSIENAVITHYKYLTPFKHLYNEYKGLEKVDFAALINHERAEIPPRDAGEMDLRSTAPLAHPLNDLDKLTGSDAIKHIEEKFNAFNCHTGYTDMFNAANLYIHQQFYADKKNLDITDEFLQFTDQLHPQQLCLPSQDQYHYRAMWKANSIRDLKDTYQWAGGKGHFRFGDFNDRRTLRQLQDEESLYDESFLKNVKTLWFDNKSKNLDNQCDVYFFNTQKLPEDHEQKNKNSIIISQGKCINIFWNPDDNKKICSLMENAVDEKRKIEERENNLLQSKGTEKLSHHQTLSTSHRQRKNHRQYPYYIPATTGRSARLPGRPQPRNMDSSSCSTDDSAMDLFPRGPSQERTNFTRQI